MATKKVATKKVTTKKAPVKAKVSKKLEDHVENIVDNVEDMVEDAAAEVKQATGEAVTSINENLETAQDWAKQAWLAGLGAVGRSADQLQDSYIKVSEGLQARYSKMSEDREQLVRELVERGEKVQIEAETMLKEGRATIEERIEEAKTKITSMVDVPARLQNVSDRLESLSNSLKKTA